MNQIDRRGMFGLLLGASAVAIAGTALVAPGEAEAAPLGFAPGSAGTPESLTEEVQFGRRRRRRVVVVRRRRRRWWRGRWIWW